MSTASTVFDSTGLTTYLLAPQRPWWRLSFLALRVQQLSFQVF